MYRSSDLTDEPSRLKQFAWEQWETQHFAVLFRPGTYSLDRYVVKRYVEQVLSQSDRWRQLSIYFSQVSPSVRSYTLTSYEIDLMQRILDSHLNDNLHMRITAASDQLIEYDDLLDFIRRAQEISRTNTVSSNGNRSLGKRVSVATIPSVHSSYVLPPSAKSLLPPVPQPTVSRTSPVKPIISKPPPIPSSTTQQTAKTVNSTVPINGHRSSTDSSSKLTSNAQVKSDIISLPIVSSTTNPVSSSNQSNLAKSPEYSPTSLYDAKIEGSGWVQINNVFLPFIIKHHQRLIPHQVLVTCKILEPDELRSALTRATSNDATLMNRMIRSCKINNEEILVDASLINVYHVLVGTKNLVYAKILPKDNPTSKINRQYKSVLALRGGSVHLTCRTVPYVCSSNHSYVPLDDVLSIYPHLNTQLKPLARVPRTHEFDYLQLVQMYFDERELPSDTLLIDMEDLNQRQIIPSKNITLNEHHSAERSKLERQIILWNNSPSNKRKNQESHDNLTSSQKMKTSMSISPSSSSAASSTLIHPPTGYYPTSSTSSSSYRPQTQLLSSNYGQRDRTR